MTSAFTTRICALLSTTALLLTGSPSPAAEKSLPKSFEKVDFERHIMGVLGRAGCNGGSCHGSFQGKGGFRLSLFGYDPEMDFYALTRESSGRRINTSDPDKSLLLLKATGAVDHGGLRRFDRNSWQYQMLRRWIAAGMPRNLGSGEVKQIRIDPPEYAFTRVGEQRQLTVEATFADGSTEDITVLCDFRTNDEAVATVTNLGLVDAKRAGDTSLVVSYRGNVLTVRVLVPMSLPPGFRYPETPEVNYVDQHVFAKLKRLNIAPAQLSSDQEFLRRVFIDTTGSLPTADEVRKFLADSDPKKREKKIDELLRSPLHAALWATKFSDITGNNTEVLENPQQLKPKFSQMWHDWFRKRVADNMPYDQIVRDVLCATSREGTTPEAYVASARKSLDAASAGFDDTYKDRQTLDLFWRRQQQVPVEQWGEKTAVAFLGVRLECAQCHKHPFDRWTQGDYWSFANLFSTVTFGISPEAKQAIDKENAELRKNAQRNQNAQIREVFVADRPRLKADPTNNKIFQPKLLGGTAVTLRPREDPRLALFEWMRQPENPFFARSFVNRVWGHYFGIGIVHPIDDFSLGNPPSNDKLLDALARDFIDSGYDLRKLERTILLSRTYQLSSAANETNKFDNNNYSRSYVRPLMAEVVVDILNDGLGVKEAVGPEAPAGARAIEVGSTRVQNAGLRQAFRVFGRSPRTVACDCERASEPTVAHKLFLMADPVLQTKMQPTRNRVAELVKQKGMTDQQILDELFLSTLSRYPTANEKQKALAYLAEKKNRLDGFGDTLWALINTTEFIFNH